MMFYFGPGNPMKSPMGTTFRSFGVGGIWLLPVHGIPNQLVLSIPLDYGFWRQSQSKSLLRFGCDIFELTKLQYFSVFP